MPSDVADRYTGRDDGHINTLLSDTAHLTNDRPPTYYSRHYGHESRRYSRATPTYTSDFYEKEDESPSKRNPKSWSRRCWLIVAVPPLIVFIIVIAVAVAVSWDNRYPDYSKLNYNLVDTYSGTSFFDNFNYFTGYDPAQGFVQ